MAALENYRSNDSQSISQYLINDSQFKKILDDIESGKKNGATLECGDEKANDKSYFIQPTVFIDVKDDMEIACEEIFGSMMSILKFDTYEETIERANASTFGLSASVITKDCKRNNSDFV